jgi:hypothetical protein
MVPLRQITLILLKNTNNGKKYKLIKIENKKRKYFIGSVDRVYCIVNILFC